MIWNLRVLDPSERFREVGTGGRLLFTYLSFLFLLFTNLFFSTIGRPTQLILFWISICQYNTKHNTKDIAGQFANGEHNSITTDDVIGGAFRKAIDLSFAVDGVLF